MLYEPLVLSQFDYCDNLYNFCLRGRDGRGAELQGIQFLYAVEKYLRLYYDYSPMNFANYLFCRFRLSSVKNQIDGVNNCER